MGWSLDVWEELKPVKRILNRTKAVGLLMALAGTAGSESDTPGWTTDEFIAAIEDALARATERGSSVADLRDCGTARGEMPPARQATTLLPPSWPSLEQELPRRIERLNSLSEVPMSAL